MIDRLNASAKVHHTLRPPLPGEMVDFAAHIAELCKVFVSDGLEQRGISLHLSIKGSVAL